MGGPPRLPADSSRHMPDAGARTPSFARSRWIRIQHPYRRCEGTGWRVRGACVGRARWNNDAEQHQRPRALLAFAGLTGAIIVTGSSLPANGRMNFTSTRVGVDPIQQVHLMENHDRSYSLWRDAAFKNRILVHIDAHHDMWWFDDNCSLTIANFVCLALRERIIREVYWVVPDGTWEDSAGRNALANHLKEILRGYPGGPAGAQWEHHRVRTSVLGCPLVICSLDTLPSFCEDVLLDIDTDYLTIPRVSYRTQDVLTPVPCRSPQ